MEVRINKEIRQYTESVFFGLSLRQLVFSVLAIGFAIGLYFILRGRFGTETVSWMCVLGAAPFAVMGFFTYNGMHAERFILTFIRSEVLGPKRLIFRPQNVYFEALRGTFEAKERILKNADKDIKKHSKARQRTHQAA